MTTVIGAAVERSDGVAKATGEAVYGIDYAEPGMLHGKLLRSPVPAGRITALELEAALALPGVRGIFSAKDAPPCLAGWVLREQPLFAREVVRFEGEPVALVVADTIAIARQALRAIRLEIEPTQIVGDLESALLPETPLVHPDWEQYVPTGPADYPRNGNVACEMIADPDPEGFKQAFADAAAVVEDEFRTPRQYQAYLEPKSALARFEGGRYVVHTAHQYPFNVRDRVAQFLGVRPSAVRVIGHHIGGGFGAKLDAALEPYAAFAAGKLRRPVKLVNDRSEDMLTCPCRENAIVRIRTALKADGTILARELVVLMDNGAYSGEMPWLASLPVHVIGQVYRPGVPRVHSRLLYTHTAPTGAFRGVGGLYLYFALERHMDTCAARLGIDRREFRLQNLIEPTDRMVNGQILEEAGILREAFERLEEIAPWSKEPIEQPADGRLRGSGLAAVTWLTNPMPASVMLKLCEDGTIGVVTAATENGSGGVAMGVTQIVAARLGVQPTDVVVMLPDTDFAGYDAGSQGSRTTHVVGRAASNAAAELTEKILAVAAGMLGEPAGDLALGEGSVVVAGKPDSSVSLADVAVTAMYSVGPLTATGSYTTAAPPFDPDCASGLLFPFFPTPTYHLHYAEVDVDPATGHVEIVRYVVVQEVGKTINPTGLRGQIQGGVAQGLGYALHENVRIIDGRYRERSFASYRLPLAVNVPEVEIVVLEHPEAQGPYGARGVAEPPAVAVAAVIGNAVAAAIGRPIDRLPITPADILDALEHQPSTQ